MKTVKAYGCSFCAMTSRTKSSVVRHEKNSCRKSPQRHRCGNCKYMLRDQETYYNRYHGGDPGSTDYDYDVFYCDKLEKDLDGVDLNSSTECLKWEVESPVPESTKD